MIAKPVDILLVEDNNADVDLVKEALAQGRVLHRLNVVDNGADALLYLKHIGQYANMSSPDIVILDLNVPRKNGFEVLKAVGEDNTMREIPFIVFTSSDLDQTVLDEYHLSPDLYVKKTGDFDSLVRVIRNTEDKMLTKLSLPAQHKSRPDKEINILLVEDNQEDADFLQEILSMKEKYTWVIKHVDRLEKAFELLEQEVFDVVVLDLYLPDSRGFETLTKLIDKQKKIPVICMTSLKDEEAAVEALRHGAQDYLIKGQISADLFLRSVQYAIERQHLDQMKDDLIGYVNHELNNPLAVVKEGVSQVVEGLKGPISPEQRSLLNIALNGVNRLEHITRQLLDSIKLDLKKLPLELDRTDLVAFVRETVNPFKLLAVKQGLEIKEVYPSSPLDVMIDKERMTQIMTNLLTNALKYTEKGYIEIVILDKEDQIVCQVKDTGRGISPSDIGKTFTKFSQFGQLERHRKGTGLGLYIAKSLIELHRGRIWVGSRLNEGTTFTFILPKA
jgi:signal transduction histidine kinase